eukprot:TRINITY_DN16270_c0_g1_i1.p1 TRINITY_DN16270_c0_g1~~TRINITY_DN16270_c0_g1_i1.p1  ORF type:complete len:894 (+),score=202.07 TRINITY_DN16270_c0_g1_i1:96-2777(+)
MTLYRAVWLVGLGAYAAAEGHAAASDCRLYTRTDGLCADGERLHSPEDCHKYAAQLHLVQPNAQGTAEVETETAWPPGCYANQFSGLVYFNKSPQGRPCGTSTVCVCAQCIEVPPQTTTPPTPQPTPAVITRVPLVVVTDAPASAEPPATAAPASPRPVTMLPVEVHVDHLPHRDFIQGFAEGVFWTAAVGGAVAGPASYYVGTVALVADGSCSKTRAALPRTLHPTGLEVFGSAPAGLVLGTLLVVVCAAVGTQFLIHLAKALGMAKVSRKLKRLYAMPGAVFFFFSLLFQGAVYAAVELTVFPGEAWLLPWGLGALLAALIFAIYVPYTLKTNIAEDASEDDGGKAQYRFDPTTRSAATTFVIGPGEWISAKGARYEEQYGVLFRSFKQHSTCYAALEYGRMALVAALAAANRGDRVTCGAARVSTAGILLLFAYIDIRTTPHARLRDVYFYPALKVLIAGGCGAIGTAFLLDDVVGGAWMSVGAALLFCATLLLLAKVVLDVVAEAYVQFLRRRQRIVTSQADNNYDCLTEGAPLQLACGQDLEMDEGQKQLALQEFLAGSYAEGSGMGHDAQGVSTPSRGRQRSMAEDVSPAVSRDSDGRTPSPIHDQDPEEMRLSGASGRLSHAPSDGFHPPVRRTRTGGGSMTEQPGRVSPPRRVQSKTMVQRQATSPTDASLSSLQPITPADAAESLRRCTSRTRMGTLDRFAFQQSSRRLRSPLHPVPAANLSSATSQPTTAFPFQRPARAHSQPDCGAEDSENADDSLVWTPTPPVRRPRLANSQTVAQDLRPSVIRRTMSASPFERKSTLPAAPAPQEHSSPTDGSLSELTASRRASRASPPTTAPRSRQQSLSVGGSYTTLEGTPPAAPLTAAPTRFKRARGFTTRTAPALL